MNSHDEVDRAGNAQSRRASQDPQKTTPSAGPRTGDRAWNRFGEAAVPLQTNFDTLDVALLAYLANETVAKLREYDEIAGPHDYRRKKSEWLSFWSGVKIGHALKCRLAALRFEPCDFIATTALGQKKFRACLILVETLVDMASAWSDALASDRERLPSALPFLARLEKGRQWLEEVEDDEPLPELPSHWKPPLDHYLQPGAILTRADDALEQIGFLKQTRFRPTRKLHFVLFDDCVEVLSYFARNRGLDPTALYRLAATGGKQLTPDMLRDAEGLVWRIYDYGAMEMAESQSLASKKETKSPLRKTSAFYDQDARRLGATDPTFIFLSERGWADRLDCHWKTAKDLPYRKETEPLRAQRNLEKKEKPPQAISLTHKLEATLGNGKQDEVLLGLIADEEKERVEHFKKRHPDVIQEFVDNFEPSPLAVDPPDLPPKRPKIRKRL